MERRQIAICVAAVLAAVAIGLWESDSPSAHAGVRKWEPFPGHVPVEGVQVYTFDCGDRGELVLAVTHDGVALERLPPEEPSRVPLPPPKVADPHGEDWVLLYDGESRLNLSNVNSSEFVLTLNPDGTVKQTPLGLWLDRVQREDPEATEQMEKALDAYRKK